MHKGILLLAVALLLGTASLALAEAGADPVTGEDSAKRVTALEAAPAYVLVYGAITGKIATDAPLETDSDAVPDESVAHTHSEECVAHTHSDEDGDHGH